MIQQEKAAIPKATSEDHLEGNFDLLTSSVATREAVEGISGL